MQATISTTLDANAEAVWSKVKCSATLSYVTKGLLGFKGFAQFPAVWQEGQTVHTRLLLFGFIPGWKHQLTFERISDLDMELSTCEAGGLNSCWNHDIEVRRLSSEQCHYVDRIDIEAGWATPLVWLYAHLFYRYRQWRWHQLVKETYFLE